MIFAAVDQPLGTYTRADIAFPSQVEVRINGDEVKANYKGLKNKPGSTRPADITEYVRKLPNYKNTIAVTYALTQKVSDPSQKRAKNEGSIISVWRDLNCILTSKQKYTVIDRKSVV